jgi:hypothetical protein
MTHDLNHFHEVHNLLLQRFPVISLIRDGKQWCSELTLYGVPDHLVPLVELAPISQ